MPVVVIDTIKPKNNLTFPIVEDVDVLIKASGARLSEVVANMATAEQITALQNALAGKASIESVTALTSLVNTKADAADLTALSATVEGKADVSALEAIQADVADNADAADLTALEAEVDTTAESSDLTTATANLQAQIDNIVSGSTADSEVINARVGADGTSYGTLKSRLDAEHNSVANTANKLVGITDNVAYYPYYTQGGYFDGGGVFHEDATWGYTPLFEVEPETTYYLNLPISQYIAIYDINKEIDTILSGGTQFTTTANTKYARISIKNTRQTSCVVTKNSTYVSKLADIDKL